MTERVLGRGDVAQLGERRPCKAEVVGSNPISSTRFFFAIDRKLWDARFLCACDAKEAWILEIQISSSLTTESGKKR